MLKILTAAALIISLPGQAWSSQSFSKCEKSRKDGAFARHVETKTEVNFSDINECRNQIENGNSPKVVCGCSQTLGGGQIFLALFTAGASLATARQWSLELKCHKFGGPKAEVIRTIDFGIYDAKTEAGQELMKSCRASELLVFNELNGGV